MGKLLQRLDPAATGLRNMARGERKGEAPGHSGTVKLKGQKAKPAKTPLG